MEILELVLKRYGKFENHRISLQPGINIIYGGNEAGKTTIHSFIRSMFYGLNRSRGKAARTDEYLIRQPWDAPGAFLGSMRIRENNEVYRIDRCFDRSAAPLQVVCETRARESANPQEDLNALLGGISENAFLNTVFVRQAQCETDEGLAEELRRYMVNTDSTMDAELDVTRALAALRKKKRAYEQKKKKEEEALEEKTEKMQAKAETIRTELEILRGQLNRYRSILTEENEQGPGGETEEEDWSKEKAGRARILLEILLALAGILAISGSVLLAQPRIRQFLGGFGIVFFLLIPFVHFFLKGETGEEQEVIWTQEEEQQIAALSGEIQKREEAYQKLKKELETAYQEQVRPDGTDTEIAALTLAIDRICELTAGICARFGGQLNERASRILSELTGGRYQKIVLDESAEVRIHTPSRVLGLHQVSGGTMQQIYFALRMAAGELLGGSAKLPVILDEAFAMYDEERLEAALRWLKGSGRQVILFTCQKREHEILGRLQ